MKKIKSAIGFGFRWSVKNWLLLLIAYFAFTTMIDASAARSYSARAMNYAEEAADHAAEAENYAEAAAEHSENASYEIDRLKWRF